MSEWISVKERLPEEQQRVIVRCERIGTSVGWILWGEWMTDIRAAHRAGIRSILVKPLVEHDSIKTQINRARERRVLKKINEKYGPIQYKKGI